ncbi:Cytoplasmic dynein 1 intermediate chain 1 [Intoshia linei]|uniref:Cytoplasmic dynein 1 intermediate chain 1 n=1 Tax=Intoshia linei TaxID=1819745 RepID=A0A177AYY4_9BILA|nr:Cytoplasmic dynein 1 intermediate chain 1 [Intoshia linei]
MSNLKKELEKKKARLVEYRRQKLIRKEREINKTKDLDGNVDITTEKSSTDLREEMDKLLQCTMGISLESQIVPQPETENIKPTDFVDKLEKFEIIPVKNLEMSNVDIQNIPSIEKIVYERGVQTENSLDYQLSSNITKNESMNVTNGKMTALGNESRQYAEPQSTSNENSTCTPSKDLSDVEKIKILTNDEFMKYTNNAEFSKFTRRAGTVIERILSIEETSANVFIQYELSDSDIEPVESHSLIFDEDLEDFNSSVPNKTGKHIKRHKHSRYTKTDTQTLTCSRVFSYEEQNITMERPISTIDWSPYHPELLACSYMENYSNSLVSGCPVSSKCSVLNSDGLVMLWNLKYPKKSPEYTFTCHSTVLSLVFAPFHPNLIIGGTYSGQLVLWDMRSNHRSPVQHSSISANINSFHTNPVYCLKAIGTGNVYNLVSISTNGMLCLWNIDMLSQPQESIKLTSNRKSVSCACFSLMSNDHNNFLLGGDDGSIYGASFHDNCQNVEKYSTRHGSAVTSIDVHPGQHDIVDFSNYFLTTSFDWSLEIWNSQAKKSIYRLENQENTSYFYGAQWSPTNPALFCSSSDIVKLSLWDISKSLDTPIAKTSKNSNAGFHTRPSTSLKIQSPDLPEKDETINDNINHLKALKTSSPIKTTSFSHLTSVPFSFNKIQWNSNSSSIAAGSSNGTLHIYDVPEFMRTVPSNESLESVNTQLTNLTDIAMSETDAAKSIKYSYLNDTFDDF